MSRVHVVEPEPAALVALVIDTDQAPHIRTVVIRYAAHTWLMCVRKLKFVLMPAVHRVTCGLSNATGTHRRARAGRARRNRDRHRSGAIRTPCGNPMRRSHLVDVCAKAQIYTKLVIATPVI